MILNEEKEGWHYLAVKKLSTLLRGITFLLGFLLSKLQSFFGTENKLKPHEKGYENKNFSRIVMPSEKDKVLEFKQYTKSDKMPYHLR